MFHPRPPPSSRVLALPLSPVIITMSVLTRWLRTTVSNQDLRTAIDCYFVLLTFVPFRSLFPSLHTHPHTHTPIHTQTPWPTNIYQHYFPPTSTSILFSQKPSLFCCLSELVECSVTLILTTPKPIVVHSSTCVCCLCFNPPPPSGSRTVHKPVSFF